MHMQYVIQGVNCVLCVFSFMFTVDSLEIPHLWMSSVHIYTRLFENLCVCVLGFVFVSVSLLSGHACHLLPLQGAPPRADVVNASSHPAPSPVPRYYHTAH